MTKYEQKVYDESFKLKVLSDYYSSSMSKKFIVKKWGISLPTFLKWERLWPIDSKELSLPSEIISRYRMGEKTDEQILRERIAKLEKSLALERLRNRALETLIEVTEREEGISIKKGGVKQ